MINEISCQFYLRKFYHDNIAWFFRILTEWKYWGCLQTNQDKLGFLVILEFKNVGFYEERRIGVHGRKHKREEEIEEKDKQQTQPDNEAELGMPAQRSAC